MATLDPVELLAEYIRIDTSNPPGDCREAADFLCRILTDHGHTPHVVSATPSKPNVACHIGGTEEPGLLLVHHMDVVPAVASDWSVPPFSGEIRDGYLYGRGTLDTKGLGIAHLVAALEAAKAGTLKRKLFFVANSDEEVGGGEGAEFFTKNLPFEFGNTYGMNEGGTGIHDLFGAGKFFLVNMWEKGPVWLKLVARGKAGHGSRPTERDAPARLCKAIARLLETREPARLSEPVRDMIAVLHAKGLLDIDPEMLSHGPADEAVLESFGHRYPEIDPLLRNTFAVTTLSAGFKPNVIPSTAEATIDARIVPGEDPVKVAARVAELVRQFDVTVETIFAEKPNGSSTGPLFDAVEAAIHVIHPDAVVVPYLCGGFTDSRFYRELGIPMYGLLPLLQRAEESSRIHGVDERIPVAGIHEMTAITKALIEGWNGGGRT